jgi:hypothetical protein
MARDAPRLSTRPRGPRAGSPSSPATLRVFSGPHAHGIPAAGGSHMPGQARLRPPAYWLAGPQRLRKAFSDWSSVYD